MYDHQEVWARSCGLPNIPITISTGCVPVEKDTIRGMTCWCKTNLCNTDLIPIDVQEPRHSNVTKVKRAYSRYEEPEL